MIDKIVYGNWSAWRACFPARRIACIASLIVWLAPHFLSAQIRVYPDSVLIVRDDQSHIGFVFPYEVAVEYRNLRAELYPEAMRVIGDLRALNAQQDSLVGNQQQQILRLENIVRNDDLAIDSLRSNLVDCEDLLSRIDKKAKFYKRTTLLAVPAAIVASLVAILK